MKPTKNKIIFLMVLLLALGGGFAYFKWNNKRKAAEVAGDIAGDDAAVAMATPDETPVQPLALVDKMQSMATEQEAGFSNLIKKV